MGKPLNSNDTRALFDDVMDYINTAKAIVEKGDFIELQGMDEQVQRLCAAIQGLSEDESKAFAEELNHMMEEMDALQKSFIAHRDVMAKDLTSINQYQSAAKAYKSSEGGPLREGISNPYDDDTPPEIIEEA